MKYRRSPSKMRGRSPLTRPPLATNINHNQKLRLRALAARKKT